MKVHLIGICGTGMGAIAGLLHAAGHEVRGSDEHVYPPMSTQLKALGVPVMSPFSPANLAWQPDVVVVGNVCRRDHVEVVAAQERGIRLTSFPAILEELLLGDCTTLVVAGTHGKTTTTAMAAWALLQAGLDPSFLIGGVPLNMPQSYRLGRGPFVIEGDEYDTAFFDKKSKFLHYRPRLAIVTSVELDHVDIFADLAQIQDSFREFARLIPPSGVLLVCGHSPGALEIAGAASCRVERYGVGEEGLEWRGEVRSTRPGGRTIFEVFRHNESVGTFDSGLPGQYNLENAVAVIAALHHLGVPGPAIERGVRLFAGVKRRQELRGMAQGVAVVDDFAHHPTAVKKTLQGLRGRYGQGQLIAVFEPRSATSRTAVFQQEFADALAAADEVVLGAVNQPEKAPAHSRLDVEQLAADIRGRGVPARALPDAGQIIEYLAGRAAAGDAVVIMSSGSFDGLHERLLRRLGDAVMPAATEDLPGITAVLQRTGLATAGLADAHLELMVLRDTAGALVGCVGLEIYGEAGLLRSLAVLPERRGEGLGWMLAEAVLFRARLRGLRHVYLLTEHATDFFAEKFGFQALARDDVPKDVQASAEFSDGRQAVAMRLDL